MIAQESHQQQLNLNKLRIKELIKSVKNNNSNSGVVVFLLFNNFLFKSKFYKKKIKSNLLLKYLYTLKLIIYNNYIKISIKNKQ